eukprot:m.212042 g.212042  ORF g.212042 m.212042 type:complete len:65 (-) comp25513_c0_seq2:56-250(-)
MRIGCHNRVRDVDTVDELATTLSLCVVVWMSQRTDARRAAGDWRGRQDALMSEEAAAACHYCER